jgi:hypothetical protein
VSSADFEATSLADPSSALLNPASARGDGAVSERGAITALLSGIGAAVVLCAVIASLVLFLLRRRPRTTTSNGSEGEMPEEIEPESGGLGGTFDWTEKRNRSRGAQEDWAMFAADGESESHSSDLRNLMWSVE